MKRILRFFGYVPYKEVEDYLNEEIKEWEEIIKTIRNGEKQTWDIGGKHQQRQLEDAFAISQNLKNMKGFMYTKLFKI